MRDLGPIDRFTIPHFLVGFGAEKVGLSWRTALALAVLYEAVEDDLLDSMPFLFPRSRPESKINSLMDIGAFLGGYVAAAYIKDKS